ncbi:MAG: hypothetical protein AAFR17_05095 [Pseudomonadota bacterium]
MSAAPGPSAYLYLLAFLALSFGLMQTIALAQRHVSAGTGTRRWLGVVVLAGAIALAALSALGQGGGWGLRLAGITAFAAVTMGLALLAAAMPERRFGPLSSLVLIVLGTMLLKLAQLFV